MESSRVRQVEQSNRNLLAGFLLGLGTVASIDEVVFHQILHWHKFYDRATTEIGLVSSARSAPIAHSRYGGFSVGGSPEPAPSSSMTAWCTAFAASQRLVRPASATLISWAVNSFYRPASGSTSPAISQPVERAFFGIQARS